MRGADAGISPKGWTRKASSISFARASRRVKAGEDVVRLADELDGDPVGRRLGGNSHVLRTRALPAASATLDTSPGEPHATVVQARPGPAARGAVSVGNVAARSRTRTVQPVVQASARTGLMLVRASQLVRDPCLVDGEVGVEAVQHAQLRQKPLLGCCARGIYRRRDVRFAPGSDESSSEARSTPNRVGGVGQPGPRKHKSLGL
jgi:hypothetical protein